MPVRFCACGCKTALKKGTALYIYEHIPRELRQEWGRKGREWGVKVERYRRFREDVDRLLKGGKFTRSDLVAAFSLVYDRAYQSGYKVALRRTVRPSIADEITARLESGPKHRRDLGSNVMAVARALSRLRGQGIVEPVERGTWALVRKAA